MTLHVLPLSHSFGVLCMNVEAVHGLEVGHSAAVRHAARLPRHSGISRPAILGRADHADRHVPLPTTETQYDCSSLEQITSGGAALPEEVRLEFERLFGCPVRSGYGLSEAAPTVSCYADGEAARPGSSGRPIPGVEVRILDDSRPAAAGRTNPAKFASAGRTS